MSRTRRLALCAGAIACTALLAGSAFAQTAEDLLNDHKTPGDVLVYGMG